MLPFAPAHVSSRFTWFSWRFPQRKARLTHVGRPPGASITVNLAGVTMAPWWDIRGAALGAVRPLLPAAGSWQI